MTNKKLDLTGNIFEIGRDTKSDIKGDTIEKTNGDIKSDIKDSNDIIIETDRVDKINVPIILRLKPSTIKNLDDIAYKTRRSRNYVAQKLLDQAITNVKLK